MLVLTTEQQNALLRRNVMRRFFIWCEARDPDTGLPDPGGFWDDIGNIEVSGKVYHGSGSVVQLATLSAGSGLEIAAMEVTLNGLDTQGVAMVRGKALSQAPITISLGIFDVDTRSLIGALVPRFVGFVDTIEINTPESSGTSNIRLVCESTSRAMTVQRSDTRSSPSQKQRAPHDLFYDYTGLQRDKPLYFGQATPVSVTAAPREPRSVAT